jgi:hypothetical protein
MPVLSWLLDILYQPTIDDLSSNDSLYNVCFQRLEHGDNVLYVMRYFLEKQKKEDLTAFKYINMLSLLIKFLNASKIAKNAERLELFYRRKAQKIRSKEYLRLDALLDSAEYQFDRLHKTKGIVEDIFDQFMSTHYPHYNIARTRDQTTVLQDINKLKNRKEIETTITELANKLGIPLSANITRPFNTPPVTPTAFYNEHIDVAFPLLSHKETHMAFPAQDVAAHNMPPHQYLLQAATDEEDLPLALGHLTLNPTAEAGAGEAEAGEPEYQEAWEAGEEEAGEAGEEEAGEEEAGGAEYQEEWQEQQEAGQQAQYAGQAAQTYYAPQLTPYQHALQWYYQHNHTHAYNHAVTFPRIYHSLLHDQNLYSQSHSPDEYFNSIYAHALQASQFR